jgi:hypothetical protein
VSNPFGNKDDKEESSIEIELVDEMKPGDFKTGSQKNRFVTFMTNRGFRGRAC